MWKKTGKSVFCIISTILPKTGAGEAGCFIV